jgi:hypothetical protein
MISKDDPAKSKQINPGKMCKKSQTKSFKKPYLSSLIVSSIKPPQKSVFPWEQS